MNKLLWIAAGICLIGYLEFVRYQNNEDPPVGLIKMQQPSVDNKTLQELDLKRKAERAKRDEEIEKAITEMEGKGVGRDELKDYFYSEIEDEVCAERECKN